MAAGSGILVAADVGLGRRSRTNWAVPDEPMLGKVFMRCLHWRICSAVTAPSFCTRSKVSRRITQPACRVRLGHETACLGFNGRVRSSMSFKQKAPAPHCLQNPGIRDGEVRAAGCCDCCLLVAQPLFAGEAGARCDANHQHAASNGHGCQ